MTVAQDERGDAGAALRKLLVAMHGWQASDLFLSEGKAPSARVHGSVVAVDMPPTTREQLHAVLDVVLTPIARERFEAEGDVDAGWSLADGRRYRFNVARHHGGINVVIRALRTGDFDLTSLGLPASVAGFAQLSRGLVLITGATGSGKSTTMAALIHHINLHRAVHVVTLEEPIEFVHHDARARVTQREVGTDTHSFASALRHVVRQSPDVIVLGELRDAETMRVAVSAALTGHVVFATVHTIDAAQTLHRLLGYFPEDERDLVALDLSMSLEGILCQRLVPRADGKGRALAVELLTMNPAARRLIAEQRVQELYDLMRGGTEADLITFNESLLRLYRDGAIDVATGRASATIPEEFLLGVQGMSTGTQSFRPDGEGEHVGTDIRTLLRYANRRGASDLHITTGRPPIVRVDGRLEAMDFAPLTAHDMRVLLHSILSTHQRSVYELERELDFALAADDGMRFRVNAYYQKGRMAAALRAIPSRIPDAAALNLPGVVLALGERAHGLLLVVGPTGSGKTTTMACLIDRINRTRPCRILTVEDPIEYLHEPRLATIDQRELGADTRSFAAALKYVLRQDPDVILVGELRDLETISSAITAAETGHLVIATLHTNDAISSIDRIIDVFPSYQQAQVRSQLAATLVGVVSQRLLPRVGGGRVPAFEVLVATSAMRTLIRDGKMHQALSVMEASVGEGMITMDRALRDLIQLGAITYEDAVRHARHVRSLQQGR